MEMPSFLSSDRTFTTHILSLLDIFKRVVFPQMLVSIENLKYSPYSIPRAVQAPAWTCRVENKHPKY